MRVQLSFGFPPSVGTEIYFFAVRPDDNAAIAIMEAARVCSAYHGLSGRRYGADRLHVSLVAVESARGVSNDEVAAAMRAAAKVRTAPFEVAFDRVCTFSGRATSPIVLRCGAGASELVELRMALRLEFVKSGLWPGPPGFEPHVTMLWDRRRVPETSLPQPIHWTVESFVLVKSLVGRSRHIDVCEWRLGYSTE